MYNNTGNAGNYLFLHDFSLNQDCTVFSPTMSFGAKSLRDHSGTIALQPGLIGIQMGGGDSESHEKKTSAGSCAALLHIFFDGTLWCSWFRLPQRPFISTVCLLIWTRLTVLCPPVGSTTV